MGLEELTAETEAALVDLQAAVWNSKILRSDARLAEATRDADDSWREEPES